MRRTRPVLMNTVPRALLSAIIASSALTGCEGRREPGSASAALIPLASCGDALGFVRQVALEKMNKAIDEQLAQFSKTGCSYYGWAEGDAASGGPVNLSPPQAAPTTGSGRAANSSTTNNQVAGVDEADFVKNDDKYIYLAQNRVLRIVDGWPAQSAHQIAKVPLDGEAKKLFVQGNRALVYVSVPDPRLVDPNNGGARSPYYGGGRECTYGYDCDFTGDGTATKLEIFDIADRSAPKKVREVFLSGSLLAARRIGNTTHTVVSDNLRLFPEVQTTIYEGICDYNNNPTSYGDPPSDEQMAKAKIAYEALRAKNTTLIQTKDLSSALPSIADSANNAGVLGTPEQLCSGVYRSQLLDGASFTTVVSVDMSATDPVNTATILSSPGAVYAGESSLYLSVPSEQGYGNMWYAGYENVKQVSTVHKFRISDHAADTAYLASGVIDGRVLNQFAMDEKDGLLRVASTTGHVPDPEVESQLTVLGQDGSALSKRGIVQHIGPKEDIRSVRFDGDRAFVVTFKKTDPLFVIDLSNPSSPSIAGELKIPGFSTYLHMLDDNHLLSIGYDANDHDDFAYFDGVLLQIFDISDSSNPTLAQRYKIGTRGSSSDALTNHLAFNYYAPLKMLALPMTVCEGGGDGTFGDNLTFSGLMLFDIDAQAGIREHGRVAYPLPDTSTWKQSGATCFNWWSSASSEVHRSIFMERYVYGVSDALLKVQSVDALGADLQSIDLEPISTQP